MSLKDCDFIVVDTETTGVDPFSNGVIEIGAVRITASGKVDRRFSGLWAPLPWMEVSSWVSHNSQSLKDARELSQPQDPLDEFFKFLTWVQDSVTNSTIFAAYNASFDISMLRSFILREGLKDEISLYSMGGFSNWNWYDILAWERHGNWAPKCTLEKVCQRRGIPLLNAHRAVADAEASALVLRQQLDDVFPDAPYAIPDTLEETLECQEWLQAKFHFQRLSAKRG